ncbi:efflux transporter outer membrane subunit [uncultured Porphyromonas sp.]|uniref:efflux transporter outer membrane subunit n=1 Tax=uncultured Porphyromonas sp. TaxID=159274 RepID=UPI00260B28B3|nr:efflux transporter outer membrane subunit [uncultured Porphyromonas sp.]
MKLKHSLPLLALVLTLSGCGLYRKYQRPTIQTSVYRGDQIDTLSRDTTSFGQTPWRSLFTDVHLQALIEKALQQNVDLLTAHLSTQQAEAQLRSARLSFLPSLSLAPSISANKTEGLPASYSYTLPVQASWQIDLFGSLLNASRSTQVQLLRAQAYQQLVRSRVITNVANSYYTLLMLDRQLQLSRSAAELATHTLEVMKAQKEVGRAMESSVQSAQANLHAVEASIPEIKRQITTTENALALLLGESPRSYPRSSLQAQQLPSSFALGVPVQLLSARPDVRVAELALASCYYQTNSARAAFYPSLNISGSAGWTGALGEAVSNPMKFIASALGSLAQPLFAHGKLVAGLRVAQAEEEKARLAFQQSLYNAGAEVSNALALYQASEAKVKAETLQVESLEKNVEIVEMLFKTGKASSYLEVITAQQSLLQAQLSLVQDSFSRMQAVVNLYNALGGGTN